MKYDLVVVGGGIVGAGVARDAALRGLKVALVEKDDFGSGTTSRSTRLIHGGLRYLAQYDFGLVHEALNERKTLLRIAPHLVRSLAFLLPVYRNRGHRLPVLWTGLALYDYLKPGRGLPHHRFLPPGVCLRLEPSLRPEGLQGGFLYYDGQCSFPERLCLENVLDAEDHGATVANHTRVVAVESRDGRVTGVRVRNDRTQEERILEADLVLNCTGPWLDDVERLTKPDGAPLLRRTKGIHLVVKRFTANAVILETADADRVVFAIPWGDYTLVGTTDTDYRGPSDDVKADERDVDYLLREVAEVLDVRLARKDVFFTTAGLRPLQNEEGRPSQITRREKIIDHERVGGLAGYATIVGGKITTYRAIAQLAVDFATRKLGRGRRSCTTAKEPLPGGRIGGRWESFVDAVVDEGRRFRIPPDVVRHLADRYGAAANSILARVGTDGHLGRRVDEQGPWIWAEIDHAVEREHAETLADVLLRRTAMGLSEGQARAAAPSVAARMAKLLGWDDARTQSEVRDYEAALERNWAVIP